MSRRWRFIGWIRSEHYGRITGHDSSQIRSLLQLLKQSLTASVFRWANDFTQHGPESPFAQRNVAITIRHYRSLWADTLRALASNRIRPMSRFFRFIVFSTLLCGLVAGVSMPASAAEPRDNAYVIMAVPDLASATAFFDNVLDCEALNGGADSSGHVILLCATGNVVELVAARGKAVAADSAPIQLPARDVSRADHWLRREGVTVTDSVVLIHGSGARTDTTIVHFVAPWGQHLQLIERNGSSNNTAVR